MKKAVLLGDHAGAPYHPLRNIDNHLRDIFKGKIDIAATDDYNVLCHSYLSGYDMLISYSDCWDSGITGEQYESLACFVASGGGLLAIHNGISMQAGPGVSRLFGARFTGHPPMQRLSLEGIDAGHEIMEGINAFEMDEEPYQFDFEGMAGKTVLFGYRLEETFYPAAWAKAFGSGRVVYLMPGHMSDSFKVPEYREIILRSGLWACTQGLASV